MTIQSGSHLNWDSNTVASPDSVTSWNSQLSLSSMAVGGLPTVVCSVIVQTAALVNKTVFINAFSSVAGMCPLYCWMYLFNDIDAPVNPGLSTVNSGKWRFPLGGGTISGAITTRYIPDNPTIITRIGWNLFTLSWTTPSNYAVLAVSNMLGAVPAGGRWAIYAQFMGL